MLSLGLALLVPLTISLLYADGSWESFLIPAAVMVAVGGVGFWATLPRSGRRLGYVLPRDVLLSVTLAWVLAALLGGIPFLVDGVFSSPIDSTFESMSGFTTTGATLLSEVEAETPSILFWRSMTQWLGGIGIVVLFVAVAPVIGFGAARLITAEVCGISQPRLTPRIADTAKVLLTVYLALSVAEVVALLVAGMSLYDAVVHAFTTIATGGFNPYTASVGFYDSVAIEAVLIIFMALSGVSFALYHVLYTGRPLRAMHDPELLTYFGITVGAVLLVWAVLVAEGDYASDWAGALKDSAFTVTSIITTTGYVTADYDQWDTMARITLVVLMFVGGCAGSTAGGIKVVSVILVFKTVLADLFRGIHPQAVTPLKLGDRVLSEDTRTAILGLVLAWFAIFAVATTLLASQENLTPLTSAPAVAATLNVVGPSLAQVGGL